MFFLITPAIGLQFLIKFRRIAMEFITFHVCFDHSKQFLANENGSNNKLLLFRLLMY